MLHREIHNEASAIIRLKINLPGFSYGFRMCMLVLQLITKVLPIVSTIECALVIRNLKLECPASIEKKMCLYVVPI